MAKAPKRPAVAEPAAAEPVSKEATGIPVPVDASETVLPFEASAKPPLGVPPADEVAAGGETFQEEAPTAAEDETAHSDAPAPADPTVIVRTSFDDESDDWLTGPFITVTAKRDGFRRAGRAWTTEGTTYPLSFFTEDEVQQLRAEPMLVVQIGT